MNAFLHGKAVSPFVAMWLFVLGVALGLWLTLGEVRRPEPVILPTVPFLVANARFTAPYRNTGPHQYIEVVDACGPSYGGEEGCVLARAGPGQEYPVVQRLRTGIVLKVDRAVLKGLRIWYRVVFDEPIRYPERVKRSQYVAADFVRHFYGDGVEMLRGHSTNGKRIIVDRSDQMLYAYEGDDLFMSTSISTGHELTPTPRGEFRIIKKTPTRYMQGPLPGISDDEYDLPGVPWNLYFTKQGGAIHGAYWHNNFGQTWSHGCVNLPLAKARQLFEWADVGVKVTVRD